MQKKEMIYGRHPVVEALQAGLSLERVYLLNSIRGDFEKEVRHLSREQDVPMMVVPKERLDKFTRANHQGVVALRSPITYYRLADVLPLVYERGELPLFLLLEGITDVRNVGAIARSAEVCGAQALVLPGKGGALINADAIKTSAGALTRLPVCRETSLVTAVNLLTESGVNVYASAMNGDKLLQQLDLTGPSAFILGSEGEGISPALARAAKESFRIPQRGETDSFNVSVAAGIMLYEAVRQRW